MERVVNNGGASLSRKEKYKWKKYGGYHPVVWILILGTAMTRTASFMSLPFLVIHLSGNLGMDSLSVGLTLGAAGLTGAFGSFVGGYLSDRWGRRLILLTSLFVWTGTFLGFALGKTFLHFFVLNALNGLCRSFFETTSQALMSDISTPEKRLKIFGYRYVAVNIGMVAGPMLGAVLFQMMGMRIFVYTAVIYLFYFMVLYQVFVLFRKDLQPQTGERVRFAECLGVIRRDRSLGYFVLAGILFFTTFSQIESSLPIHLGELGKDAELFALLLTINAVVVILLQYPMNRWAGKKSVLTGLVVGSVLCITGYFAFGVGDSNLFFILGIVLLTLGEILVFPVSSLFIDRIADERMRGIYYGANGFGQLGLFIGPLLGGWLLEVVGGRGLWLLMVLLMVYALFFYAMGYRVFGQRQKVTLLDIVRRVLLDLRLIFAIKRMVKMLPPLLLIVAFTVFISDQWVSRALANPPRTETVSIRIQDEASLFEIGRELKRNGVISNEWLFPLYGFRYTLQEQTRFEPGTYQIQPEMGLKSVMKTMTGGTWTVVIPEGATVREMGLVLKYHGISEKEWTRAVNSEVYDYPFLDSIPKNRPYRLEGYLAPGRYEFNRDADAEEVVEAMLNRFNEGITPNIQAELKENQLSVDYWVTVASLIEKQEPDHRKKTAVARDFKERLRRGVPLGVRTLPAPYGELYDYQVWVHQGLPPGPVSNPGSASLEAVLFFIDPDHSSSSSDPGDEGNPDTSGGILSDTP